MRWWIVKYSFGRADGGEADHGFPQMTAVYALTAAEAMKLAETQIQAETGRTAITVLDVCPDDQLRWERPERVETLTVELLTLPPVERRAHLRARAATWRADGGPVGETELAAKVADYLLGALPPMTPALLAGEATVKAGRR